MGVSNKIANVSLEHFSKLPMTGKPTVKQWTILSTIVQENAKNNTFEVVALGTGSKCIGRNQMSERGDILNDSHAEIMCRRSFLKYLYSEMKNCINNSRTDVLDFSHVTYKFLIKDCINFHFFTTHVPCGDAAIFPKCDGDDPGEKKRVNDEEIENVGKRIKLDDSCVTDVYRTGAKCLPDGEIHDPQEAGINFHVVGPIRTKPGRGDSTASVSCSDKIAKWCFMGLQGSLLSFYLNRPVYLVSFTLADKIPYSKNALERAFGSRFNEVSLSEPFEKHSISIHQSEYVFEFAKTEARMPCPSSISWWKGIRKHEVAIDGKKQGITKMKRNSKESRLGICKMELMRDFVDIANTVKLSNVPRSPQYNELKMLSTTYQNAWNTLKNDIFRVYTCKDPKLLCFKLD